MRYKKLAPLIATIVLLSCLTLVACGIGTAQPKRFTIGVLSPSASVESVFTGFKSGMAKLGYVEGQNVTYLYDGPVPVDQLPAAAQKLMQADVDLILAIATSAATAAHEAVKGTEIPVVFWVITDPVQAGYVQSMNKPGGNLTGVTIGIKGTPTEGRRLEWLKQIAPAIKQVYIPYNPDDPIVVQGLKTVGEVAPKLGVELIAKEVRTVEEAAAATESIPPDADAIFIFADRVATADYQKLVEIANGQRLPTSFTIPVAVENNGLMSFGPEFPAIGEQVAHLADQIFKGAKPADLPVETPEFFLTINVKTAKAIGLTIPDDILRQADRVIR